MSPKAEGVRGAAFAAGRGYFQGVARAGGVPLILPPLLDTLDHIGSLLDRVDGIVLHGGGDVDPRRYGHEPTSEVYGIVHEHDEVEFAVVRAALERDIPMLAICRGMQVLNVALGGSLLQHIGDDGHWFQEHPVTVEPDSHIAAAVGSARLDACHSVHHQALDRLGVDLRAVGHSDDGVVEAVEHTRNRWVIATQWHPEDTASGDAQQQALFDALVAHA